MVHGPFANRLKIAARMQSVEVGPVVIIREAVLGEQLEREDANVALAHEICPKRLNAVVWACCQCPL